MKELAFYIQDIGKENGFYKFSMKGYADELTYEMDMLIREGLHEGTMDTGEYHFHENAMILRRTNDLSDNVLLALSRKYDIGLKHRTRMAPEKTVFNIFPLTGNPANPGQKPLSLKCFLGDGSVEFYVTIDPGNKIMSLYSRSGCEEALLNELMVE